MGNVVMTEAQIPVESYIALNEKYLQLMKKQIGGSQQLRSQQGAAIKRASIFRNKHEMSMKVHQVMLKTNLDSIDYTQFEQKCIKALNKLTHRKISALQTVELSFDSDESDQ